MEKSYSSLTVLFEPPFWVGIFELTYNGRYCACKVTFGAEPAHQPDSDWRSQKGGRPEGAGSQDRL